MINNLDLMGILEVVIKIIVILILMKVVIRLGSRLINNFFEKQKTTKFGLNDRKADTLKELFKSLLRYSVYVLSFIWIFETLGFDVKTLIAVTGVAGVAIGFGAQSLVRDVISGFFILMEDQFAVGDYVTIDGLSGVVEALGIRVTKLRDFSGDLHIIPNGSISKVTNRSRGNMRALVDVTVAYEEDVDRSIDLLKKICKEVRDDFETIVEGPEVLGVVNFLETGYVIRIVAKTLPMKQWDVEMELRRRIKSQFDKEKIQIAVPKRVIVNK